MMAEEEELASNCRPVQIGNGSMAEDYNDGPIDPPPCMRYVRLPGSEPAKQNDVIICGDAGATRQHVIYFGGDVQDYTEKMLFHRDGKRYNRWNLENTAQLLHRKFKGSTIFVVKPSKMHYGTFSVFGNLVHSNDVGVPDHSIGQGSWYHLLQLYKNAIKESIHIRQCRKIDTESELLQPIQLIGFSKGCVVLNQLIHDLLAEDMEPMTRKFIDRVQTFYWLDGGHSGGGKKTWITDERILQNLAQSKCKVSVHVTPYQLKDPTRVSIGQEEKLFVNKLQRLKCNIKDKVYYSSEPRSIDKHFQLLQDFEVDE